MGFTKTILKEGSGTGPTAGKEVTGLNYILL